MTDSAYRLLEDVQIVLLRPRWARNLGSVARAMKNFGLRKLTICDSQIGSWNDAYQMAVHANDILDTAVTSDLTTALANSSWVVGTSNNVPPGTRLLTPRLGRPFEPDRVEAIDPWWREVGTPLLVADTAPSGA